MILKSNLYQPHFFNIFTSYRKVLTALLNSMLPISCNMYIRLSFVVWLFFSIQPSFAQQGIASAGADATSANGSINFTIGQIDYIETTGTTGSVAQGLQQPYTISVVSSIENGIEITASLFPNPASEMIVLSFSEKPAKGVNYTLYTLDGIILDKNNLTDFSTSIPIAEMKNGVYYLKISNQNSDLKIFKFVILK